MEKASTDLAAPGRRRARRRPADITADLLAAAAVEFAAHGFEGASTRRIAERADAHQPQINYHFASKEQLWQATVTRLFELLAAEPVAPGPAPAADDLEAVLAATLRRFLHFSARHPELNRIINLEATSPSPRLTWLVGTHLRPLHDAVHQVWGEIRAGGGGADLPADEVWELITTYGALRFANEPMLSLLGITSGTSAADVDAHADRLVALLLPALLRR